MHMIGNDGRSADRLGHDVRMRWRRRLGKAAVAATVAVAAAHLAGGAGRTTVAAPAVLPAHEPAGAAGDRLLIEPDDGIAPIDRLLAAPRRSLDLEIYELSDPTAESILAADAGRGVRVRVVLDRHLEGARNAAAAAYLRSSGVLLAWAGPAFFASHEKAFVVDDAVAVVMSLNLVSTDYATTRDAAVVDRDPADVAAIETVFAADFAGRPVGTPAADDLVWSPGQSAADLVALINGAHHSIVAESEELSSPRVIDALIQAARRGVAVSLAMTDETSWHSAWTALVAAGGHVAVMYGERPLYIHAKLLAIDAGEPDGRAFVGSENFSDASLLHDRELGIVLVAPGLVDTVGRVVAADVRAGRSWP